MGQQLAALNESRNETNENTVYLKAKSDGINIRKSASADGTRIGSAAAGDEFQLVEELDDGWSEIIFNGQSAYVKSEYFDKVEPESSAADTSEEGSTDEASAEEASSEEGTQEGEP